MEIGKIPSSILNEIILKPINQKNFKRNEVLIRPSIGEDCCALNIEAENIVMSSDPITGAEKGIGKLAINININDVVSSGAEPIGVMVTILMPKDSKKEELEQILNEIYNEANYQKIEVLGGHTEVTESVNKPIICCTILGKTKNKNFISTGGAKVGQSVIMTKWAGLEGTNIIINDLDYKIKSVLDEKSINEIKQIDLCVREEATIARDLGATCMHDVTEGGVLGACWEIAEASNCGINIFLDKIPVLESTKKITQYFKINPYRLISSGVLLITAFNPQKIIDKLNKNNINSEVIGEIVNQSFGKHIYFSNQKEILTESFGDELYKVLINN